MNFKTITSSDELWCRVRNYAESCSWRAGKALANAMDKNAFSDWERVIVAVGSTSAGVMFADADLIGAPVRVIVSPKGLKAGTIEISARDKSMQEKIAADEAIDFVYNYVVSELEKLECRL